MIIHEDEWTGIDIDIRISLFEQGIVWHKNEHCTGEEYHFMIHLYGDKYQTGYLDESDIEFADLPDILSFTGLSEQEWEELSLPRKIVDVYYLCGGLNLMSSAHPIWEHEIEIV